MALLLIGYVVLRAGFPESKISLPVAHEPLLIIGTGLQLLLILIAFADIPYGNLGMGWGWAAFIGLLAAIAAAAPVMVPAARSYLEAPTRTPARAANYARRRSPVRGGRGARGGLPAVAGAQYDDERAQAGEREQEVGDQVRRCLGQRSARRRGGRLPSRPGEVGQREADALVQSQAR